MNRSQQGDPVTGLTRLPSQVSLLLSGKESHACARGTAVPIFYSIIKSHPSWRRSRPETKACQASVTLVS